MKLFFKRQGYAQNLGDITSKWALRESVRKSQKELQRYYISNLLLKICCEYTLFVPL